LPIWRATEEIQHLVDKRTKVDQANQARAAAKLQAWARAKCSGEGGEVAGGCQKDGPHLES